MVQIFQETVYTHILRLKVWVLWKLDFTIEFYTFINVGNKFKISKNDQNWASKNQLKKHDKKPCPTQYSITFFGFYVKWLLPSF